jgi:hypothetical protein
LNEDFFDDKFIEGTLQMLTFYLLVIKRVVTVVALEILIHHSEVDLLSIFIHYAKESKILKSVKVYLKRDVDDTKKSWRI